MAAQTIKDYFIKRSELQQKVITAYIESIKVDIEIKRSILADTNWASTGEGYHKEIRKRYQAEIEEKEQEIEMLSA